MSAGQDDALALRRELYDLVTRYRLSAIVLASLELDLYSHIPPEGIGAEQLAERVGCRPHPLGLLLEALAGIGVLAAEGGRYLLPSDLAELLVREPGSFADFLLLQRDHYASWSDLAALVRGAESEPAREAGVLASSEQMVHYLELISANNRLTHEAVAGSLAPVLREASLVLDLGGGNARFAELLTARHPDLRVRVLDVEAAIAVGRSRLGEPERIELVAGDARSFEAPQADVVTLNDMLHYFSRAEKRDVLAGAVRALRPGGTIAVCNHRLDGAPGDRASSALFSLRMFVDTQKGYVESAAETREILAEIGVADVSETLVAGHKVLLQGKRG